MAATAVYASITRISPGSLSTDNQKFSNIAASSSVFQLLGGTYGIAIILSTPGTVTLETLGPDGTTFLPVTAAIATNGYSTAILAQGQYKVVLA
jgi:hypothetical protein